MSQSPAYFYSVLPPQKLSSAQKTPKWGQQCLDAIQGMGNAQLQNGRSSRYKKQINYDLYNSKFDEADFDYVLNPYGAKDTYGGNPAKMQNYNIIRSKIELLKGEELSRPFNFRAVAVNGEAVTMREKELTRSLQESMLQTIASMIGQAPAPEDTPESIRKFFSTEYVSVPEVLTNQLLKYLVPKLYLPMKFNQGFEHGLISAEEIYYVGIVDGEPSLRVVNPLNFDYDKSPDLKFVEEGQWAREERYLPLGTILDEYGEYLSEEDLSRLDKGEMGNSFHAGDMLPGFAYRPEEFLQKNHNPHQKASSSHIYVLNCVWKSMRKIGFLTYFDEKGQKQETLVEEDFKLDDVLKAHGATLEWEWVNEVWEGTKIGRDIYVNIRPRRNSGGNLPYIGYLYNNTNSQATSLVDLVKPHQYTYMIVWFRLEMELAKAKGKKFVMDIAQLPKSKGWTLDQWLYYFDNLGVAWINSAEEGREGDPNTVSKFNQFTDIDMSLSNVVQQYMMILAKLEEQVANICGISKQRESQIMASETASGIERSVAQSTAITEPLFFYHNLLKQRVLTELIETAKVAYQGTTKLQYAVDDTCVQFLQLDGGLLENSDFAVFITDSGKEQRIIEKMEQLAQVALQSDKASLTDMIAIMETQSLSLIKSKLVESEQKRDAQQEQQNQIQQQQIQAQQAAAQQQREFEQLESEKDRQLQRDIKQMDVDSKLLSADSNGNGIPDAVDIAKLQLEREKLFLQKQETESERFLQEIQHQRETQLKEKELRYKEKDSIRKVQIARSRPKPKK